MSQPQPGVDDDYDLKVDEQVEKFLELNHTLTFFLVTASVGTLGFSLTYAKEQFPKTETNLLLLLLMGVAALLALLAGWAGLRALSHDQASFRLHLQYRYQRKTWADLSQKEQDHWDKETKAAASTRRAAFNLLVGTVAAQVLFLFSLLAIKEDFPMQHYGKSTTSVAITGSCYHLEFRNKVSGAKITMDVPVVGALEDPQGRLTPAAARRLADEAANLLRRVLG